jgi:hypothetical protein
MKSELIDHIDWVLRFKKYTRNLCKSTRLTKKWFRSNLVTISMSAVFGYDEFVPFEELVSPSEWWQLGEENVEERESDDI